MTPAPRLRSHPAGGRVDLAWSLDRPTVASGVPALRLTRRQLGEPLDPADGERLLELTEVTTPTGAGWARITRRTFRTRNTACSGGVLEAALSFFYLASGDPEPARVGVRIFDPAAQALLEGLLGEVSRVVITQPAVPTWNRADRYEVFQTPGGGPEVAAGVFESLTGGLLGQADQVRWTPDGGPTLAAEHDGEALLQLVGTTTPDPGYDILSATAARPWLRLTLIPRPESGMTRWEFTLADHDLEPATQYYYALFELGATPPRLWTGAALATRDFGSADRLFRRLPGAYQRLDEPDPSTPTGAAGPLRRLLAPMGQVLDLGRSVAEGSAGRTDLHSTRSDLLPHLGGLIGWPTDRTAPAARQRRDLLVAPELYGTLGTAGHARALVDRVTGWPVSIKEFAHNVFLTNAPERPGLWELWQISHDGTGWGLPAAVTLTTGIDGRPALATDGGGTVWLLWHSDRNGRRELWRQRLDGVDPSPVPVLAGAPDELPSLQAIDEDPAVVWDGSTVRVFWSSNRAGQWDLWGRNFAGAPPASDAERLTSHPAADRSPAAVVVPGGAGRLWLFWSSSRRGPVDIWGQSQDLGTGVWSGAERLTTAPLKDERPAAAVDGAGRIWLFWSRDHGGRQVLCFRMHDGISWQPEQTLDTGHRRDVAPAAVAWLGGVLLLWHSDHAGPWQLWAAFLDGVTTPAPLRLNSDVMGDLEPAATLDGTGALRLVWRTQRRAGWYRSRTLDLDDAHMLAEMGTLHDHGHYVYDTGRGPDDWYSRESVGLYLEPDTTDPAAIAAAAARTASFMEPFRPAPMRYVWPLDATAHEEPIEIGTLPAESWAEIP